GVTNTQGSVEVVYEAPARNDATANQTIMILARIVGNDFNGQVYSSVRIELRSAEPRLFPPNGANNPPVCNFTVETPNGLRRNQSILFQSTSFDPDPGGQIVRYFWDFSDGSFGDKPDVNHVFRLAGLYTVTHTVTDNYGAQAACAVSLAIQ